MKNNNDRSGGVEVGAWEAKFLCSCFTGIVINMWTYYVCMSIFKSIQVASTPNNSKNVGIKTCNFKTLSIMTTFGSRELLLEQ